MSEKEQLFQAFVRPVHDGIFRVALAMLPVCGGDLVAALVRAQVEWDRLSEALDKGIPIPGRTDEWLSGTPTELGIRYLPKD